MNDELDTMTDAQLNEVFAVEVAGYELRRSYVGVLCRVKDKLINGDTLVVDIESFTADANAVLPYLKSYRAYDWHKDSEERARLNGGVCVGLVNGPCAYAPTLARAACIARIRQARLTK